jgi:hypothetical protein
MVRRYVTVGARGISVSGEERQADAVVHVDRALLEAMLDGRANAFASALRGTLVLEGDFRLVMALERLFARIGSSGDDERAITEAGRPHG